MVLHASTATARDREIVSHVFVNRFLADGFEMARAAECIQVIDVGLDLGSGHVTGPAQWRHVCEAFKIVSTTPDINDM